MRYYYTSDTLYIRGKYHAAGTGINGGIADVSTIFNHTVPSDFSHDNPKEYVESILRKKGYGSDAFGLLTAVFLSEMAGKHIGNIVRSAVELLAAIPSVIYGLIGMMILNPMMFRLEKAIYAGNPAHQYTGGANMLSAIIVLAIMILPTVISVSTSSLKAVPENLRAASLTLGATKEQTIFKTVIPAAKSGIKSANISPNTMIAPAIIIPTNITK